MVDPRWRDEAWKLLADEIRAARDARGLTQAALALEAGVGIRTLQDLEAGITRGRMPRLMPRVERALGWRPGSARAILDGGSPIPAEPLRPRHLSREHKEVIAYFLENSDMTPAIRRGLIAELKAIPELD